MFPDEMLSVKLISALNTSRVFKNEYSFARFWWNCACKFTYGKLCWNCPYKVSTMWNYVVYTWNFRILKRLGKLSLFSPCIKIRPYFQKFCQSVISGSKFRGFFFQRLREDLFSWMDDGFFLHFKWMAKAALWSSNKNNNEKQQMTLFQF